MNGISRLGDAPAVDGPASRAGGEPALQPLAASIIYMCELIADRPRAIDRCIDYFGETLPAPGAAPASQRDRQQPGPQ